MYITIYVKGPQSLWIIYFLWSAYILHGILKSTVLVDLGPFVENVDRDSAIQGPDWDVESLFLLSSP